MLSAILRRLRPNHAAPRDPWHYLTRNVLEVRDLACLKKAMGWTHDPFLDGTHLTDFEYMEDLNERRLRDAEVLGAACCNGGPKTILEIGTAVGYSTALMALNAPNAVVHTVNIPPEEIQEGGRFTTVALSREEIGSYYRSRGLTNIRQILANTAHWQPDLGPVDVVFVDGCHDATFVFNDTRKVLPACRPGTLILWHDFAPSLIPVYDWIRDVCLGVERLYAEGLLAGPILHVRDSWVGLYRLPQSTPSRTGEAN